MWKSIIRDLATGFAALVLVMLGFATGVITEDLRLLVAVTGVLYFAAAALWRAAPPVRLWLRVVSVICGSTAPVVAMSMTGVAFTSRPHFVIFVVTSLVATVVGAWARRPWRPGQARVSLTVAVCWIALTVSVGYLAVPVMLERLFSEPVRLAPAFAFTAPDGRRIDNQSLRGRVVVLAFWATWCAPCREELPRLETVYARYRNDPNVVFLAVNDERDADVARAAEKATTYFARARLELPLAIADHQTTGTLGVSGLPTLMVIDRDGNIRLVHRGYDAAERLDRIVVDQIRRLSQRS